MHAIPLVPTCKSVMYHFWKIQKLFQDYSNTLGFIIYLLPGVLQQMQFSKLCKNIRDKIHKISNGFQYLGGNRLTKLDNYTLRDLTSTNIWIIHCIY
jgi:hypothetical protein